MSVVRTGADLPAGERTLNPFAIVDGAAELITFVEEVFDGVQRAQARTPMPSGLARLRDPWGNLWWLYAPARGGDATPHWEGGSTYLFDSLDVALREA
ncbi:hypothetical protein [Fodinicola acaciae]|uniref:hypothetical protein n=1 Tax=Fodinicola acaciae TaxID=2681555 RepID=UPI0013D184CD|nr:hypothetical protein [Fodinicola acaciae]